jgi:hypothetical protein
MSGGRGVIFKQPHDYLGYTIIRVLLKEKKDTVGMDSKGGIKI